MDRKKLKQKIKDHALDALLVANFLGLMGTAGRLAYGVSESLHAQKTLQEAYNTTANYALFKAADEGNVEDFKKAVQNGADLNALNENNDNCLMVAIRSMYLGLDNQVAKYILSTPEIYKQINFEATNSQGENALDMMLSVIERYENQFRNLQRPPTNFQIFLRSQLEKIMKENAHNTQTNKTSFAFHQKIMQQGKTAEK